MVSSIIALEYYLKAVSRLQWKDKDSKQPGDLGELRRQKPEFRKASDQNLQERLSERRELLRER